MLEAAKRLHTSALIPFIPRQIMLEAHSIATAQKEDKKRRKAAAAAAATAEIEEKKEKRKKKKSSEILDADSRALKTLDLDRTNGGTLPQKGKGRGILLSSIAAFLESNGFSKTLAVFQSEAQPEINGGKTSVMNLEDLFCKFLESSRSDAEITIDWQKEQDPEKAGIQGNGHCENILVATDHLHIKKRKNINIIGAGTTAVNTSGDKTVLKKLVCAEDSHVEIKDKKKKKKLVSDSLGENTEKCHLEGSHGTENTDHANQLPKPHVNDKEKRKKKHKECEDTVKSRELVEEKTEELKSLTHNSYTPSAESNPKHKEEKKKKTKRTTDSLYENAEQLELGASQEVINKKSKELKSSGCENTNFKLLDSVAKDASIKNVMDNTDSKSKDRKKNRGNPISESLDAVSSYQLNGGSSQDGKEGHTNLGKSDSRKEKALVFEGDIDSETISKKRKRLASEEKASQAENEVLTKNSGDAKFEGAEDNKGTRTHQKQDNEYLAIGKKRKTEKSNENSTKTVKASPTEQLNSLIEHKETPSACDSPKEAEGYQLANGKPEKKEREGDTSSREMKNGKRSVEPKTVNAFQRVKIDEVKFTDERLQDNSYWAKGGADSGYGAKAQEILGQVRGRDFRHEKTKKKRGSYRGGQIDLDSHSIKFNYSDEE